VSIDWERSVHPDLAEELAQERDQAPPPAARSSRRGRGPKASESPPEQPQGPSDGEAPEAAPEAEPEWLTQWREAKDPAEAFGILAKNMPREQLEKDATLSGYIGHRADVLERERQTRRQKEAEEREKLDAAANNDLYTLGQISQREIQQQIQNQQLAQQAAWGMDGVVLFQNALDPEVQKVVQGRQYGVGKGQAEGFAEYLQAVHDASVKLAVDREIRARESALRKSVLTEVNGDSPVPERENGTPARVREVTDEQIAAMSLKEYDALFDENGHPRPGVRHRATRGIPLRPN